MKTKLSKKILSAFLAMLMVVTSVPLASVTAFAADDAAVTEVKNAMAAFERQLQTEGAFTNVTNAYNAYVDCQRLSTLIFTAAKPTLLPARQAILIPLFLKSVHLPAIRVLLFRHSQVIRPLQ